MKKLIFTLLAMAILSFSSMAAAHTLWVNMTDYSPAFNERMGAATKSYLGWGHGYPVADFMTSDYLNTYGLVGPDGKRSEFKPESGGFLAENVRMKREGAYYVFADVKPGFYTMYEKDGRVHHHTGPIEGLSNIILSLYYEQYAKALVTVGEVDLDALTKPIGHTLEIIPLENPGVLNKGDKLKVKVLFRGKPARYSRVFATYQGFSTEDDYAFATTSDGNGVATIRLLHYGPWLVKAEKQTGTDDETEGKCLNNKYTATLTFQVP